MTTEHTSELWVEDDGLWWWECSACEAVGAAEVKDEAVQQLEEHQNERAFAEQTNMQPRVPRRVPL